MEIAEQAATPTSKARATETAKPELDVFAEFGAATDAPRAASTRSRSGRGDSSRAKSEQGQSERPASSRAKTTSRKKADAPTEQGVEQGAQENSSADAPLKTASRGRKRKTAEPTPLDEVTAALNGALEEVSRRHDGQPDDSQAGPEAGAQQEGTAKRAPKTRSAAKAKSAAKSESAEEEPAGKRRSKRIETETESEGADETPQAEESQSKTERSTRSKRGRSQRAAKAPLFSAADEVEEDEDETSEIRLAATTLLFQAPDVAPRARRRKAVPVEVEVVAEEIDEDAADPEAAVEDEPVDEIAQDLAALARSRDEVDDDAESDDDSDDEDGPQRRRRRRRGGRGRRKGGNDNAGDSDSDDSAESAPEEPAEESETGEESEGSSRRRRRRRRGGKSGDGDDSSSGSSRAANDQVVALKGSTRLEAKRQRRREGRDAGRRRQIITEAEFLARRESVDRSMIVRERAGRTQIAVLEDGVLVEHYVSQQSQASMAGNVYLGRVQNVLPSMEAAFVDIGKGRNAVLYAGEVNWDAAGIADGQPRRIEQALKSGDTVVVQVTKDPIGHKGARLTSQITLAGRYLVFVPGGGMTGISRKLPEPERVRLKKILRAVVPDGAGVIVRTAAEGASEEELTADIARLQTQWENIEKKSKNASAPSLLQGEPDMAIRVVRDIFNDDFKELVVSGNGVYQELHSYLHELAPDLESKMTKWTSQTDVFASHRIDEQLAKGMDRKVWLPSGGSLVIDRTEAMTVIDVNTGKFTGTGGTLEETVTRNNLEAAEEIVRQLRLRDIGGIVVVDFIDMVLESNRDLVLRRLVECLGRDRTRHQVAEVTSLGLVQMTRKRVGQGLVEAFSETCSHCLGRGFIVHAEPIERGHAQQADEENGGGPKKSSRRRKNSNADAQPAAAPVPVLPEASSKEREVVKATLAQIAAAAAHAHEHDGEASQVESASLVEPGKIEPVDTESTASPVELIEPVDTESTASPVELIEPVETESEPALLVELVDTESASPVERVESEPAAPPVEPVETPSVQAEPGDAGTVEGEAVESKPAKAKRPVRRRKTRP
ncbi:hypothetical protein GCM10010401_18910 [Rarobacter faecitabidus]